MKKLVRYLPVAFIVLFLLLGDLVLLMKYKAAKEESAKYQNMYMQSSQIGFTRIDRDYYEAWDGSEIRLRGKARIWLFLCSLRRTIAVPASSRSSGGAR